MSGVWVAFFIELPKLIMVLVFMSVFKLDFLFTINLKMSAEVKKIVMIFFIVLFFMLAFEFFYSVSNGEKFRNILYIFIFVAAKFFDVSSEDLLRRGIINNFIGCKFAKNNFGVLKTLVLSGLIFGFLNIFRVFNSFSKLENVLFYCFGAFLNGMFFSVIYLRTGSIYISVIFNFILRIFCDFNLVFLDRNISEVFKELTSKFGYFSNIFSNLSSAIFHCLFIFILIFIFLRKNGYNEIIENQKHIGENLLK